MAGLCSVVNFPGNIAYAAAAYTGTALTDTSPLPQLTLGAGSLKVGDLFLVTAFGRYTCSASATNVTAGIYFGGVAGVALGAAAATALTVSLTNAPWRIEYMFRVLSLGATGSIFGQGKFLLGNSLTNFVTSAMPGTANAAVTVDTTTAKTLTLGMSATVAQSLTCDLFVVEQKTVTP